MTTAGPWEAPISNTEPASVFFFLSPASASRWISRTTCGTTSAFISAPASASDPPWRLRVFVVKAPKIHHEDAKKSGGLTGADECAHEFPRHNGSHHIHIDPCVREKPARILDVVHSRRLHLYFAEAG